VYTVRPEPVVELQAPTPTPASAWTEPRGERRIAIGMLAGFAAWTGLAIGWSQSAEQSVTEVGRIAAYLGVLVLAIAVQGRTAAAAAHSSTIHQTTTPASLRTTMS
jgi:hypothetical protein